MTQHGFLAAYAAIVTARTMRRFTVALSFLLLLQSAAFPPAPTSLTAKADSKTQVSLAWKLVTRNERYVIVERLDPEAAGWMQIARLVPASTAAIDTTVVAGTTYTYRVYTQNNKGSSAAATVNVATPPDVPIPPPLLAGVITVDPAGITESSIKATATPPTGGVAPYSGQFTLWDSATNTTVVSTVLPASSPITWTFENLAADHNYRVGLVETDSADPPTTVRPGEVAVRTLTLPPPPPPPVAKVQVYPQAIARLQAIPTSGTAAEKAMLAAFKTKLDGTLNSIMPGSYQGSSIPLATEYALGWQLFKDDRYAHKAIAWMNASIDNFQGSTGHYTMSLRFLARGDGTTTSWVLPHTPIPASFSAKTSPVKIKTQVHTAAGANSQDDLGAAYQSILKVSNTSDGPADYAEGVDWKDNQDLYLSLLDWSLPGREPAVGATYYVTWANPYTGGVAIPKTAYTLNGNSLTLATPPDANTVVWVQYMYGDKYQQTANMTGGFRNCFIDAGYTARNMNYIAPLLDWVWDFPGLDGISRDRALDLIARWGLYSTNGTQTPRDNHYGKHFPYGANNGYHHNYTSGHFLARCWAACATKGRHPAAAQLAADLVAFRNTFIDTDLVAPPNTNPFSSYLGGFVAEGWPDYGTGTAQRFLLGSQALLESGIFPEISRERVFAKQAGLAFIHSLAATNTTHPTGRYGVYPPRPPRNGFKVFGVLSGDPTVAGLEAWFRKVGATGVSLDLPEILCGNSNVAPLDPVAAGLPRSYYGPGNGYTIARGAWDFNSVYSSLVCGNQARIPNPNPQGVVYLDRGNGTPTADDLVVNAVQWAGSEGLDSMIHANVVSFSPGVAQGHYNRGPAHGNVITLYESNEAAGYDLTACDYRWSWSKDNISTPASECTRTKLHLLNKGKVFVFDRAGALALATPKQLQWYLGGPITASGGAYTATVGQSKLFGQTFASTPFTAIVDSPLTSGNKPVHRLVVNPASPVVSVRYTTVWEPVPLATAAGSPTQQVTTADGMFSGATCGDDLVLFGSFATGQGTTGYVQTPAASTYQFSGAADMTHTIMDLSPGASYAVQGAATATVKASPSGVIQFKTQGTGQQTVTLGRAA